MPTLNSCDKQCRPLCYPRLANLSETAPVTKNVKTDLLTACVSANLLLALKKTTVRIY